MLQILPRSLIYGPWSEATFGGATSFEVQLPDQSLEEPPEMPAPQPWPEGAALVDSLHSLWWSTVVMALLLFSASICLTSSCADWVKSQIDSANPGWADLLDQNDPSGL
eukprot:Skav210677  [mRNA]  locus=scaffold346:7645:13955:+ [translate_table: standard]